MKEKRDKRLANMQIAYTVGLTAVVFATQFAPPLERSWLVAWFFLIVGIVCLVVGYLLGNKA